MSNLEWSLHRSERLEFPMKQRTHAAVCIFTAEQHTPLHIHQPLHPQVRLIIPSPASLSWGACCQFIRLFLLISHFPQRRHPSHSVRSSVRGLRAKQSGTADGRSWLGWSSGCTKRHRAKSSLKLLCYQPVSNLTMLRRKKKEKFFSHFD